MSVYLFLKLSERYVVAANPFTTNLLNNALRNREYMKWAISAAFVVGVLASFVAAKLDRIVF